MTFALIDRWPPDEKAGVVALCGHDTCQPAAHPTAPELGEAPRPSSHPSREAKPATDHLEKAAPTPNPTRAHPPDHHTRLTPTTAVPHHQNPNQSITHPKTRTTLTPDHPGKPAPNLNYHRPPTRRTRPDVRDCGWNAPVPRRRPPGYGARALSPFCSCGA